MSVPYKIVDRPGSTRPVAHQDASCFAGAAPSSDCRRNRGLPRLSRHAGVAAGDEPRARSELGLRAALALNCQIASLHQVGPQELLLSRPAEELPDQPVRFAVQPRRLARDQVPASPTAKREYKRSASASSAHISKRMPAKTCTTRVARAAITRVDLNRTGTPLLEIVSKPEMNRPRRRWRISKRFG